MSGERASISLPISASVTSTGVEGQWLGTSGHMGKEGIGYKSELPFFGDIGGSSYGLGTGRASPSVVWWGVHLPLSRIR